MFAKAFLWLGVFCLIVGACGFDLTAIIIGILLTAGSTSAYRYKRRSI
jgi:hypothetical protein